MAVGLGCMRLSTDVARDDVRSAEVLDAALAAGVDLLDTADVYAHDAADVGHNERLVAAAVARHGGAVELVTKGGLVRPDGDWVPDGRAKHLHAAALASRERLGRAPDLYLLHAVDRRTPLATSVRALDAIRRDGLARAIGLCNVHRHQLDEACTLAPIAAVQLELNPWKLDSVRSGLVAHCLARGIRVLAHRPLGAVTGARRIAREPVLCAIAARLGITPAQLVLAWCRSLGAVPLPGATRVETAVSAARAATLVLDEAARAELAAHYLDIAPDVRVVVPGAVDAEVVLVMGMPASGKTTLAAEYVARGYERLNRDERGGTLTELARALRQRLAAGATRIVVDNTYPSRASRALVLAAARQRGARVHGIVVTRPLEQAQANAVHRLLELHGRLLEPDELARGKRAPGVFGPNAQFKWRREYEPPSLDEGFTTLVEHVATRPTSGTRPATMFELDDVLWIGRPRVPAEVVLAPGAHAHVAAHRDRVLGGTTWQPGQTREDVAALQARLVELLGVALDVWCCTHPAGPPICWCRKPLPGLALAFARAHDVDLTASVHVGRSAADAGFARRAGMSFVPVTSSA